MTFTLIAAIALAVQPPTKNEVIDGESTQLLAARKGHRYQVSEALELLEVAAQQLAAPERPVGSVTRPVEDERKSWAGFAVLGEARGRMGMVMLNAYELCILLERPLGGEVLRVKVVRDQLGFDAKHCEIELEVGAEGLVGRLGVQVAQMG